MTTDSGISVITGGQRAALRPALCRVSEWQGPVLVDCAAGLDPDAVRPLRHADATLFVSTDDPQCLTDTKKTRGVARRLGSAPRGVVIRSTATQQSGTVPIDWTVHTHLPYVEVPLENEQLRAEYRSLSKELFQRRVSLSAHGR